MGVFDVKLPANESELVYFYMNAMFDDLLPRVWYGLNNTSNEAF